MLGAHPRAVRRALSRFQSLSETVYDLFQRGDLPGWKVSRAGLITKAAVLWWLEASTTPRTTAAQDAALARGPAGYARRAGEKAMGISSL
jgi:hypothetical protein